MGLEEESQGRVKSGVSFATEAVKSVFETHKIALTPYLPKDDLVGGSVPYVPGMEREAVWNAAAQACATERVHFCYTIEGNRCWYLATPSSSLASNPDSWCPLAAALPGNSEYWDKDTVYIYEQEGTAGAVRWDKDTGRIQVYLGASRTILPRLQSTDVNFVTINPSKVTPILWQNIFLNREKLSRILIKSMFFLACILTLGSFVMWAGIYIVSSIMRPDLQKAREASIQAADSLMMQAINAYQNNTDKHVARIIELLNQTGSFGGILTKYEVKDGDKVEWTALIPNAVNPDQIKAVAIGSEGDRIKIKGTK